MHYAGASGSTACIRLLLRARASARSRHSTLSITTISRPLFHDLHVSYVVKEAVTCAASLLQ